MGKVAFFLLGYERIGWKFVLKAKTDCMWRCLDGEI